MAEALVEFDYKAQASDELTIKKGDIITDITFIPGGWWEGTLKGGKRGMFPDNFVKLIKNEDGENTPTSSGRKCKVLFPYKPLNEDELELEVGDVIDIISEVEEGWWKGSLRHMIGVFPSNFVAEITDLKSETREASQRKPKLSRDESVKHTTVPQRMSSTTTEGQSGGKTAESSPDVPVLPPKPAKEVCKALYKYEANNSDELSLHPGDVICLISKEGQDPGWWKGELRGRVGVFPDNFVEVLSPPHHPSETNKSEKSSKMLSSRGSISKSATTSSICDSITSITRKISDTSKTTDDKIAPTVGKKPPPPLKKPQTTPHSTTTTTTKLLDSPPGHTARLISSSSTTIKHSNTTAECSNLGSNSKWTVVETSDGTDGLCWSKQQSYSFKNENNTSSVSVSSSNSSGVALTGGELDLDAVGRTAMLTHPTASRAKAPRSRRPPSTILLREDLKNGEELGSPEGGAPSTLVNGDAGSHQEQEKPSSQQPPPWVEELKLNQAKKSIQGKTRVMIGGGGGLSGASPADGPGGGTTGQLAQSPPTADSLLSRVTLRSSRLSGGGSESQPPPQRPQSMVSNLKSLGAVISPSTAPATTSEPQVTVSLKQWNQLVDKVTNLETHMESQMNGLTKALKELTGKLDEERQRRMVMQQELEKLTELVTQV